MGVQYDPESVVHMGFEAVGGSRTCSAGASGSPQNPSGNPTLVAARVYRAACVGLIGVWTPGR